MNKIKKALDVLKSDCGNKLIINSMIGVLEQEVIHLENSFDASCNHNQELQEKLKAADEVVDMILSAIHANPDLHSEFAKTDHTALMELMMFHEAKYNGEDNDKAR